MVNDERTAKLLLGVETKGTDKAAKSVQDLSDKIRKDLTGSLKEANKAASSIDVKAAAGGGAPAAAKFRGAASLVGGGEIVGLIDDLQDLGEGFSTLASQGGKLGAAMVGTLAPAIGSTAAGVAIAGLAFAGAGIAIAVLGAALKAFTDEQARQAKIIEDIVEAQRTVDEKINAGATTKELNEERELLIRNLEDEKKRLADLNAQYAAQFKDEGITDIFSAVFLGAEEGLSNSIKTTEDSITSLQIKTDALAGGLNDGELAANDMKAAEEELAKQRDKEAAGILSQAAAAGQLVSAQRSALNATEEQNTARLASIEDEKAAIQAQIAVLQASGSTAESVTSEIEKLNASLGTLGQESQFISGTALAASKARDAEKKAVEAAADAQKKAQQDAERNAERAAAAQTKYNEAIASAGENLKQATADINTKLKQGLADNLEGMFRDVTDIATKFRRDTFDADIKANQAERDALTDHLRDIDDIREDGRKSERDAIQDGDFKALYLARQATAEALRNEQKETQRETSDRRRADTDARADLLRNAQRERADRMLGYERQNADSRTAAQRELQQAQLARTRSLEAAANAYRAELAQLGQYLQARNQMQAQANQQALQQSGGGSSRAGNTQSNRGISGQSTIDMSGVAGFVGRMIR